MARQLVILGAGGVGREIAAVLKKYPLQHYTLAGFVDDGVEAGTIINGLTVLGGMSWIHDNCKDLGVILAFGNPQLRQEFGEALQHLPLFYPTLIHPNASIHEQHTVKIGEGCYIADGCILTTDIVIGDFCFINTACSLQHDTIIKSYSVLMPGVRITGGATIGSGVYIAPNCAVAVNCLINDNAIITESILN